MKRILCIIITFNLILAVDYGSEIQPIFNDNCTNCHNTESSSYSNHQLDLTSYLDLMLGGESGDVIVLGNSISSILWNEIDSGDMPPGNNPDLSSSEIDSKIKGTCVSNNAWHLAFLQSNKRRAFFSIRV